MIGPGMRYSKIVKPMIFMFLEALYFRILRHMNKYNGVELNVFDFLRVTMVKTVFIVVFKVKYLNNIFTRHLLCNVTDDFLNVSQCKIILMKK